MSLDRRPARVVWRTRCAAFLLCAAVATLAGCSRREASASSPELQALLHRGTAGGARDAWQAVTAFYDARDHRLAWSHDEGPNDRAAAGLEVLRRAVDHGLDPSDYGESELSQQHAELAREASDSPERRTALAQFDLRLTTALLELGRNVAVGRLQPSVIDARWNIERELPDFAAALQEAIGQSVPAFLDTVQPRHPEYAALRKALTSLRAQAERGWPAVPRVSLKLGEWNQATIALRQPWPPPATWMLPRSPGRHNSMPASKPRCVPSRSITASRPADASIHPRSPR
jgi:murein L,D-transpeptidase YcbB/YkuD